MRLIALTVVAITLASCRREAQSPALPADTVATVGTEPLLRSDFDHALTTAGNRPPADVLRALTDEETMAQAARAEGLAGDPSVRAAIRRMLAARLREKYQQPVTVSDAEVDAALASETTSAPPAPARLRLAFLRQQFENAGSEAAAIAKLEEARTKWLALPPDPSRTAFGALAVEYSDDTDTRYQGGDAGWTPAGERHVLLPAEATAAAAQCPQAGLVPEIIRAGKAAWLVLVQDIKKAPAAAPNTAAIRARLTAAKTAEQEAALLAKARAAAPVKILITPPEPPVTTPATPAPPANP